MLQHRHKIGNITSLPISEKYVKPLSNFFSEDELNADNDNAGDLLLGANAIAAALGITRRQTYKLIYADEIPTFKLGGSVAARRSTLDVALTLKEQQGRAAA